MPKIILIGYRGTGKSSVGQKLSERLGIPFFDTDSLIEKQADKTIEAIVAEKGWTFFRSIERAVILEVRDRDHCIISTGGGVFDDHNNREVFKNRSNIFIWLDAQDTILVKRIKEDNLQGNCRPALSDKDLAEETKLLLERRRPIYQELAHLRLDTTHMIINETVDEIVCFIKEHYGRKFYRNPF